MLLGPARAGFFPAALVGRWPVGPGGWLEGGSVPAGRVSAGIPSGLCRGLRAGFSFGNLLTLPAPVGRPPCAPSASQGPELGQVGWDFLHDFIDVQK